jgi:hypothetical protein
MMLRFSDALLSREQMRAVKGGDGYSNTYTNNPGGTGTGAQTAKNGLKGGGCSTIMMGTSGPYIVAVACPPGGYRP